MRRVHRTYGLEELCLPSVRKDMVKSSASSRLGSWYYVTLESQWRYANKRRPSIRPWMANKASGRRAWTFLQHTSGKTSLDNLRQLVQIGPSSDNLPKIDK